MPREGKTQVNEIGLNNLKITFLSYRFLKNVHIMGVFVITFQIVDNDFFITILSSVCNYLEISRLH